MELKRKRQRRIFPGKDLLIVPYGIETYWILFFMFLGIMNF